MAAPTYNASGTNGLTPLVFEPSGFSGLLSATGVTTRVNVSPVEPQSVTSRSPGANWTVEHTTGLAAREVTIDVQVKCDLEASINAVELIIDRYLADGRAYAFADGHGRGNPYVRIRRARKLGPRVRAFNGALVQPFQLTFAVLLPKTDASTSL